VKNYKLLLRSIPKEVQELFHILYDSKFNV